MLSGRSRASRSSSAKRPSGSTLTAQPCRTSQCWRSTPSHGTIANPAPRKLRIGAEVATDDAAVPDKLLQCFNRKQAAGISPALVHAILIELRCVDAIETVHRAADGQRIGVIRSRRGERQQQNREHRRPDTIETTKVFERTQVRGVSSANRARVRQHTPFAPCMPYLIHHYRLPLAVLSRTPGPPSTDLCSCRLQVEARRPISAVKQQGRRASRRVVDLAFLLLAGWGARWMSKRLPTGKPCRNRSRAPDLAILRAPRLHEKRKACSAWNRVFIAIAEAVCDRGHVMVAHALLRCCGVQRQPKPARAHCPGVVTLGPRRRICVQWHGFPTAAEESSHAVGPGFRRGGGARRRVEPRRILAACFGRRRAN